MVGFPDPVKVAFVLVFVVGVTYQIAEVLIEMQAGVYQSNKEVIHFMARCTAGGACMYQGR